MYIQFGVDIYKIIMDKKNHCGIIYNNFLIFLKISTVFVLEIVL